MNQSTLLQKSLTVWLITALLLVTGAADVLGAFVRTNLSGVVTNECGYGYGYDSISGYGNWYWTTCASASSPIMWGGTYRYVPLDSELAAARRNGTGSTTTGWTTWVKKPTTGSNNWSNTNPYGSNYTNWDDGLNNGSTQNWGTNTNGSINPTSIDTSAPATTPTRVIIRRTLPATGIN